MIPHTVIVKPDGTLLIDGKELGVGAHTHPISDITNLQSSLDGKAASSHSHAQSEVTNLVTDLAAKAALVHTHTQADITNLVSDLAAKAPLVHTHAQSDVTGLVADLAAKVPTTRSVGTQHSLAGGGALAADLTLNLVNDTAAPGLNKVYGTDAAGLRGWKNDPGGASNELFLNKQAPASNQVITAAYSAYLADLYECAAGIDTEIGVDAVLEIG